jgi:redox-sensitive bicupin YhaK (pirin superfamily)
VHLRRAIGWGEPEEFDPFLLLDDFRSDTPKEYEKGFPWHPHRGIETITYVLKGTVEHRDSIGNSGEIGAGDLQWMTAGSGIYHEEMPAGDREGAMHGFQLWANLPARDKMMKPRYQDVKETDIPEVEELNGVRVKVIAGAHESVRGPIKDIVIEPEYYDISMPANAIHEHRVKKGKKVFAYVIGGTISPAPDTEPFDYYIEDRHYRDLGNDRSFGDGTLILFSDGDCVRLRAGDTGARFLLVAGNPIREPIAWYGPIVMNTDEEISLAYEELENGTFIKHDQPGDTGGSYA